MIDDTYQKRFLQKEQKAYHCLDLMPFKDLPDGRRFKLNDIYSRGPGSCFEQKDLYTTRVFGTRNDEIEQYLFGHIDDSGACAINGLLANDWQLLSKYFISLFEFMDAQKLRTPKGLDWIRSNYYQLSQNELMFEMQFLRTMHCTMWAEGIREIVSAENSDVKFIVSDHPITIYNHACPPDSEICKYPNDPLIAWKASQTIYPLDLNHCFIITNLEYGRDPEGVDPLSCRTYARHHAQTVTRWDNIIRNRCLTSHEVCAINYILKSRARKYIAAAEQDWLYPESSINHPDWNALKQIMLPSKNDICEFGGEFYAGGEKGLIWHQDEFGRQHTTYDNRNDLVRQLSIKERNLTLYNAVIDIFKARHGDWNSIRENITDDRIRELYKVIGWLWNPDTEIMDLLPRPRNLLSACYSGTIDPRITPLTILGYSLYVDRIIMVSPFVNPRVMNKDYSPVDNPSQYTLDTLKTLSIFLQVIPFIDADIVEMIPDPCDFDPYLRHRLHSIATTRMKYRPIRKEDLEDGTELMHDDFKKYLLYSPPERVKQIMRHADPNLSEKEQDKLLEYLEQLRQTDPLAPLNTIGDQDKNGQLQLLRLGGTLEMALYLSQISGSFIYTDVKYRWEEIQSATLKRSRDDRDNPWLPVVDELNKLHHSITIISDPTCVIEIKEQGIVNDMILLYRRIFDVACHHNSYEAVDKEAKEIAYLIKQLKISEHGDLIFRKWMEYRERNKMEEDQVFRMNMHLNHYIPFDGLGSNGVYQMLLTHGFNSSRIERVPYGIHFDLHAMS
jgi:hypothetical protein